ncbi:hypothetical protein DACRYDRAFT_53525, partial [Dacryopinax primogenitus]
GKTFLVDTLLAWLRSNGHIVLVFAPTGIAATIYEHGQTVHSLFCIPVKDDHIGILSEIRIPSGWADLIHAASLIVFDEMPGANKTTGEAIDMVCHHIMSCDIPFGGLPFLGLGDFRQLVPVVKGTGETAALQASILSSPLWPMFKIHHLHAPVRNRDDPEFSAFVDYIGEDTSGE